jgi:hypothetical protein
MKRTRKWGKEDKVDLELIVCFLVVILLHVFVGTCFSQQIFGQWRASDPRCQSADPNCCLQHGGAIRQIVPAVVQPYGRTVPYTPPGTSQYVPAAPPSIGGQGQTSVAGTIVFDEKEPETLKSTVWVVGKLYGKHWHAVGSVIAYDDSRGERRLLILTARFDTREETTVGFSRIDPGRRAVHLVSGLLGLIEIESSARPSWYMTIDMNPARPGDRVERQGFVPDYSDTPHEEKETVCKVSPFTGVGTVEGYRKGMMVVKTELKEGFPGAPIYSEDGLQAVTIMTGGSSGLAYGISTTEILKWISTTRVKLEGNSYTVGDGPVADPNFVCAPATILPGPAEDDVDEGSGEIEPTDSLDIDISLPDEEEPEEDGSDDDDNTIILLLEEIANDVQGITTKVDDLTSRVEQLEMGYDLLEKKCKDGSQGPPGPPGSSPTAVEVVDVLKQDDAFLASVAVLVPVVPPTPPTSKTHLVLVRDTGGEYWERMSGELKRARDHFSGIREVDPPQFATPMPRLIGYDDGTAVLDVQGVRNVSDSLQAIARGEFSFPRKER